VKADAWTSETALANDQNYQTSLIQQGGEHMQPDQTARLRTRVGYAALVMVAMGINSLFGGCTPDAGKGVPPSTQASGGSDRVQALMVAQIPLLAAADRIKALDPQGLGLGGLRLDIEQRTLEVWWKGDVPASVREEIARQERAGGIRVQLRPARYTQRELVELTRNMMQRAGEYPGLVSAGPMVDGSGLEIGVSDTARAASYKFPVPVRIVSARKLVPLTRHADGEPWSAGAATKLNFDPIKPASCSTGFAMHGAFGKQGMLTADHCSCGGNVEFFTGAGVAIGLADTDHNNLYTDSLLISTSSPGATTFSGGVGVGEFKRTVVGKQSNFVGMLTCTSGAGTGEHCGILIDAVAQWSFTLPPSVPGPPLVTFCSQPYLQGISVGHQMFGGVAAGQGDSGGPVYSPLLDPRTVLADGMIIGGDEATPPAVPCPTFACFNRVAFHDMDTLEVSHNASLFWQSPSAPTQAGGATTISMVVFGGATGLWALIRRSRRSRSKPQRSTENRSVDLRT
jgi:hypothetical protein